MDDTIIDYRALTELEDTGGDDGYSSPPSSALSPASTAASGDEGEDDGAGSTRTEMENFTYWPYGFQLKGVYDHGKKNSEIMGVAYNGRMRQFVILDSKGITTWSKDAIEHTVHRAMNYPKYEYRLITHLTYVRKYNVYFVLSKDFAVKVLNRDFEETCRVSADLRSVLFMLFNPVTDELITGGVGGTKVWRYHQVANKTWKEIRPMANYKLTLKYELKNVGGSWVKKVELDLAQQHLYCCSDTDLHAYDMEGNSLFQFERAHQMSITGCAYSPHARCLITASADREVKVWSVTGGLVHTFRGHSQAVTDLVLHPEDSSLVLTSSLDGTVRMWSLDILEPIYSMVVSSEGVRWMGLTEDNLLYLSTVQNLSVWSLNMTTTFWSLARCKLTSLRLAHGHGGKSTRVVAVGDDSSVRVLSRASRKSISMVMPPPPISPLSKIKGVTHVRDVNVSYVLINSRYLWLYTNRSDPACRMAVWDLLDIQTKLLAGTNSRGQQNQDDQEKKPGSAMFGGQGSNRATLEGTGNETVSECRCVCYLNSAAAVSTEEGPCCPIQHRYLLLGLEDGRILFMDPLIKGKRYLEFRANKDAISHMEHDERHSTLVTRCDLGDAVLLQLWDLPSLRLMYEIYSPPDITVFARLDDSFLTGHENGAILLHKLIPVEEGQSTNKQKSLRQDIAAIFAVADKTGHKKAVTSLDVCYSLRLFLSASTDGLIKIWDESKSQVSEIQLDESLTAACFLNDHGDVITAFKNHIFFIDRFKVSDENVATDGASQDDGEESDQFEDTSMLTDLGESSEPIDMRLYLVPYKSQLAKEFNAGGKYVGVESPKELNEDKHRAYDILLESRSMLNEEAEEENRIEMAPSEVYDSPRSTPHDLALLDLTLSANVTNFDLGIEPEVPADQLKRRRMTPKERRRALKRKSRIRSVQFEAPPKYDRTLGVQLPQFGGSPCSTPRSSLSSLGSGSDEEGDDGCSWLSYSTGGRSTPEDLSWESGSDYDEASGEERPGSPSASPRRERKPRPTPLAKDGKDATDNSKPKEDKVRRRPSRYIDNIKLDAKQVLEEEERKARAERKRQRRQADQAVDRTEEEVATTTTLQVVAEASEPEPPARKIREIKKKEKRFARRVSAKEAPKLDELNTATDSKNSPEQSQLEKDRLEAEARAKEEERVRKEQEYEEEKKRSLAKEEEERQKANQIKTQKEEDLKKWKEEEEREKQEAAKRKQEEEKKRQAAQELLERDKRERERKEELQKAKAARDAKINALLKSDSDKADKRASNSKPKSAKGGRSRGGGGSGSAAKSHKSGSKHKRAPPKMKVREEEPSSQMAQLNPEEAKPEEPVEKKSLQIALPSTDQDAVEELVEKATQVDEDVENAEDAEDPLLDSLTGAPPSLLGGPPSISSAAPSLRGLGDSMISHMALTEQTTGSMVCPDSPAPTSLTGFSEFNPGSMISPPLSPSRLSVVSSCRPGATSAMSSFLSRPHTGVYSELSAATGTKSHRVMKTVTFSPPSSPSPMGIPPSSTHHDVQSWLASAPTDDVTTAPADAAVESASIHGDGRSSDVGGAELSRAESPTIASDAGTEMTVPHVDLPAFLMERDDDWWWRKSRGRRRPPSSVMSLPADGTSSRRQRPHTACHFSELTNEELEKVFNDTLQHYQSTVGTPEKLHQNDGTQFEDNWHDRAIERHQLLKMQRHIRAQSASDKARRIFSEQQQRRRSLVDKKKSKDAASVPPVERPVISVTRASSSAATRASSCAGRVSSSVTRAGTAISRTSSGTTKNLPVSPGRAQSVLSMPAGGGAGRKSRMSSAAPSVKPRPATAAGRMQFTPVPSEAASRLVDKAELGAEMPFRCRITPPAPSMARARSATIQKEEIDLRLLDPRNPVSGQFRQRTGASVPSKCSRYVLVESGRINPAEVKVMPTVLEQRLITKRFPQHQDEWIGHAKPPPRFRPPLLLYHPPAFNQYATT